jgi:hypothetical protein
MFGMPDIIVPWFLPRPGEPGRKTLPQGACCRRNSLGMRIARPYRFLHRLRTRTNPREISIGLHSDFDGLARQFPKSRCELFTFAAKSSQALNQLSFKSSGENHPIQFESFASKPR